MEKPSDRGARWRPSARYGLLAVARNGGLYLVGLGSIPILAAAAPWLPLAAMPVVGLAMYRLTIVMHDCIHGTLFASPRANRIIGVLAGAASGIEFYAFARLHRQHHRIFGAPGDPQGMDYLLPEYASRGAILWHLFRPLLGGTVLKLGGVFATLHRDADLRETSAATSLALVVLVQCLAAAIVSRGLKTWWLVPLPLLAAATFGLFFAQLRGFAEHVAMPGTDPRGSVRSHRPTLTDRIFLYDLNFNFHREHHLYPEVPSCWLPELHARLALEDAAQASLSGSMLGTIRARLAAGRGAR